MDEEQGQYEAELKDSIKEGEFFEELITIRGWELFEEEMLLRLKGCGTLLQSSNDEKQMFRLQGRMQELNALLSYAKRKIEDKKSAQVELEGREDIVR